MDPPEALRIELAGARSLGLAFDVAWPQAVQRAARVSDKPEEWLPALAAGREAWERSYDRLPPTPAEHALVVIAETPASELPLEAQLLEGRFCEWCDRRMPDDRDPRARFCDERCRRAANYELERQAVGHAPRGRDPHGLEAIRTPAIVAQLCECCALNWVLAPGRFCSSWCEDRG